MRFVYLNKNSRILNLGQSFLKCRITERGLAKFHFRGKEVTKGNGISPIRRCVEGFCESENALTYLRM
ncbi:hypothetical protein HNP69_002336 [Chryseobacterium koreense]|nr:hypothetical protein [Chryseobacterium koreense]